MSDPVPTSFTCNENDYPSIESIPVYATELIFEENSYSSIQTLDLSRFTQLKTLIVKNGAFANCYYVYLDNPDLAVIDIGDNCFTGVPPTGEARRLAGFPATFVIANVLNLSTFKIGSGSLTSVSSIDIGNVSDSVQMTVGHGSFSNVETIIVEDSNVSQVFGNSLAGAIESGNPGKTVAVVIRPTEAPTTLPPTTLPPTTLPPTTLPPTTLPPTTLPPTTLPPTTLPPTTLPPTTLPPTTQPPVICDPQPLVISSNSDCYKINQNGWTSITVNEGYCNSITGDINISNNPCLQSIVVKKRAFMNVNSLTISNNPLLQTIETDGNTSYNSNPFENLKSYVLISSYPYFILG